MHEVLVTMGGFALFIVVLSVVGYYFFLRWRDSDNHKAERFRNPRS